MIWLLPESLLSFSLNNCRLMRKVKMLASLSLECTGGDEKE